jgi:ABC-2 type transport system permease protein
VRALLAGKVIGNTILAMGQILVLAAIAVVGLTVTGQSEVLQGIGAPLAWFAVFFLLGFILLAALFAAAAAMVSRMEDIGSTTAPHLPDHDPVLPRHLLQRQPAGADDHVVRAVLGARRHAHAPVHRRGAVVGAAAVLGILAVTCVGAIWVGAKIYENSLLRMGARVKLSEALRG